MPNMKQKKQQQGFTLIELMIVVAIIGILASIALPTYSQYIAKAKFTETVLSTAGVKTAMEVCIQNGDSLANCADGGTTVAGKRVNGSLTGAANGNLVTSVAVATTSGKITATAVSTDGLDGQTYILTPSVSNNAVTWTLDTTSTCIAKNYC
jgi:type IV pilus assembly protein PilA